MAQSTSRTSWRSSAIGLPARLGRWFRAQRRLQLQARQREAGRLSPAFEVAAWRAPRREAARFSFAFEVAVERAPRREAARFSFAFEVEVERAPRRPPRRPHRGA